MQSVWRRGRGGFAVWRRQGVVRGRFEGAVHLFSTESNKKKKEDVMRMTTKMVPSRKFLEIPDLNRMEIKYSRKKLPPVFPVSPQGAATGRSNPLEGFNWNEFADQVERLSQEWSEVFRSLSVTDLEKIENGESLLETPKKVDTSLPLPRERKVDKLGRAYGTGRRKKSVACVWIKEGNGEIRINRRRLVDFFKIEHSRFHAIEPLIVTQQIGRFDVNVFAHGGGFSGQAGAMRHGLARALQNWNPKWRNIMKPLKMLRRDPRMVERKKGGQKKARKKFQWVKR